MDFRHSMLAGALAAALAAGAASAAPQLSADEIIAKQVAARGGLDKLRAIKTLRFEGQLIAPGGFRLQVVQTVSRPGMVRQDATIQGLTIVQAYDGAKGWTIQPFGGRKDPQALTPDDVKDLADEADIDGVLVDYKAKGSTVESLGTEDVDGSPAYKLRVTEKSGDQLTVFIDADTFMTIRVSARRTIRGSDDVSVTDLGDYEQVAGVYFPFEITSSAGPGGGGGRRGGGGATIAYEKGEANVQVDEAIFHMPGGAK
jgi:hypothetical protein